MKDKNQSVFKKVPWGVIAGISLVFVIYLTVAVVALYIILNAVAGATNSSIGLFENWYQTLLFALDIVFGIILIGSLVAFALVRLGKIGGKSDHRPIVRSACAVVEFFFIILLIIAYVGSSIAMNYSSQIDSALGITRYQSQEVASDETVDSEYYKSDYYYDDGTYNDAAMRANSMDVAQRTADESTVLLWNNDETLPLSSGAKVGIFGVSAQKSKYLYTGTGSGKVSYTGDDTIKDALEDNGIDVYDNLWKLYTYISGSYGSTTVSAGSVGVDDSNYGEYRINEAPWSALTSYDNSTFSGAVLSSYSSYRDAAIMVISRNGGEDYDTNFYDGSGRDECFDDNYLDLSAAEADVIENLCDMKTTGKVSKVILIINSATAVQFKNIKNYDIDACLWVGMGGNVSATQIANAITGASNPSGHLVDTYVYDTYSAPANENFGDYTFSSYSGLPETYKYTHNNKYIVYQEGIYVGYKYYETRYEDYVMGNGNADASTGVYAGSGSWNYNDEVAFTFGYGLSYTTFSYSDYTVNKNSEGDYDISVTITNTGDTYSGKEVVQIYLQKPYTDYDVQYGIEKASVELVGFTKTEELAPGESQTVTLTVDDYEFKTYDSYNKQTYILEQGDYYLAIGTSSHDALNNILAMKGYTTTNGMDYNGDDSFAYKISVARDDYETYSVSPYTGAEVTNQFDNADINLYEGTSDQKITYLSRSDWKNTYPSAVDMTCLNSTFIADMQYTSGIVEDEDAEMPLYETISEEYGQLSLVMLMDLDYDDEMWDVLMDQTSWAEQTYLVTYGSHVFAGAESINAPGGLSQNGPSGINQENPTLGSCMIFPCQVNMAATWNTELIEELGEAFGMEMMHVGYEGLNGPGANIHRSAFSGRNWEYYSEDGFISGEMLSAETVGMMNRGAILFVKHMLLNDEERNRYGVSVWANEQSIREVYAKSFEKACAVTHLNGIMSSFNRIGATWAGKHSGLLTGLLRTEWGFEGAVESDAAVGRHMGVANTDSATDAQVTAEALIAGQDFWLGGGSTTKLDAYKDNATVAVALREAARRVLYAQLHSTAMNGITSSTQIIMITPWWESALNGLKIVTPILVAVGGVATISAYTVSIIKRKKNKKGEEQS